MAIAAASRARGEAAGQTVARSTDGAAQLLDCWWRHQDDRTQPSRLGLDPWVGGYQDEREKTITTSNGSQKGKPRDARQAVLRDDEIDRPCGFGSPRTGHGVAKLRLTFASHDLVPIAKEDKSQQAAELAIVLAKQDAQGRALVVKFEIGSVSAR